MGKVVERVRITNIFHPEKSVEVDALIDTGATMVVLPQNIVDKLGLRKVREVKVRYSNNKIEMKGMRKLLKNVVYILYRKRLVRMISILNLYHQYCLHSLPF